MLGPGSIGRMHGAPRLFARTDAAAKEQLPLPPHHFDKMRINSVAAHEYELVALALANNAVDRSRKERIYGGADESWRDIGATNGFKRYSKVEGQAQHYRVQGVVCAPMVNVMSMLYAERNSSIVARRNVFYGNGLDGQNLKTLRERTTTDRHQHMALRWEAFNVSTATVNYKFDSSFLEYTGITLDQDRAPVGFKVVHTMEIPECQSLLKSHGLRRMEGTETMVLRASANSSYTEITIEGSFEVADKLPATVIGSYLTQITQQLTKVPLEIQAHRLGAIKVLDKSQWVRMSERKNCGVCLSRFGMMGKKHHCRACGEVICKSCIVARPHSEEEKFCKKCVVVACAEDELVIPDRLNPLNTPSSHSSSSSSRQRDVVRDSYANLVQRGSDQDRLSATVFNATVFQQPQRPSPSFRQQQPHYYQDKMGVEEIKHREENHSMTASETSYGSTFSNSGCFAENIAPSYDDGYYYRQQPEDSMIYLDTQSMMRTASNSSNVGLGESSAFGSGRGYSRAQPPPTMHDVESSLAHQRHLLKEMMLQAGQVNQPRSYRQYPTTPNNF